MAAIKPAYFRQFKFRLKPYRGHGPLLHKRIIRRLG